MKEQVVRVILVLVLLVILSYTIYKYVSISDGTDEKTQKIKDELLASVVLSSTVIVILIFVTVLTNPLNKFFEVINISEPPPEPSMLDKVVDTLNAVPEDVKAEIIDKFAPKILDNVGKFLSGPKKRR